jgi:myo-inositol-1-phosphate synthase
MKKMRLAIAGVGNNTSALVQGLGFYGTERGKHLPGVARPSLNGIGVTDIEVVAAFDLANDKVGRPLSAAIFAPPNNYPNLHAPVVEPDPSVLMGISDATDAQQLRGVASVLEKQHAEVLLYSLPTGLPAIARAYAEAALAAGVAVVNCTPDPIAGLPELLEEARGKGVPVVGDDLQSHFGSSVVHGALLALFENRGLTMNGSYQLNCGGNADFANLRQRGGVKESSKHNALRQKVRDTSRVTVVPSAGFVPHLEDRKVGLMSFEALGWANMPVKLDVTLQVQDSSNAAGVIIDLIRIAVIARRRREGGFPIAATPLLKSPPIVEEPQRQLQHAHEMLAASAGGQGI